MGFTRTMPGYGQGYVVKTDTTTAAPTITDASVPSTNQIIITSIYTRTDSATTFAVKDSATTIMLIPAPATSQVLDIRIPITAGNGCSLSLVGNASATAYFAYEIIPVL